MAHQVESEQESSSSDQPEAPGEDSGKPSPLKRPGVKRAFLIGLTVVLLVLIAWFIYHQLRGRYFEGTNDAYLRADSVTISPKVSGYVEELFVTDNQDVRAGQPLLRIDPRDYRASAAQSHAQIDVALANVDNVEAGIREQQAVIDQARAQLATAQANARFAADQVTRYEPLAASGAETREHLSSLRNQATDAQHQVAERQAALESAERRIGSLRAQVQQARAQGEAARAQLDAANVNLGSTLIRASIAGRVGDKSVRVGQFVTPGVRMMSLVPVDQIYVIANFKETQIGRMRPGQPATIHVDALGGVALHGHVDSLSPGTGAEFSLLPPQNATGNFTKIVQRVPVKIAIETGSEARRVLVPGLSVTVEVDTISAKGSDKPIADQERQLRQARQ